ncbi:HesA/MoeB/ThiF family protein [Saccharomonospora xinjiangensis]|uniref:Dinucleotide-utilizing enzyme possibly involved in molybdopterin or thiamin biosynthesis n=1 Tax=Saccharomonospora xinjiangensis XJ-54 TaxID=882086 RepID=I0UYW0_9PSEU|nr:ThiF family adenylyltransferase [Saccharomonospora xinjiangensis]EID53063.1 dinucleotide-utilizing enzyme possibly involved in molybdopterin or thiamin biosynthesis [Saccharomonospora xinjiangensis XJ-54]
MRVRLKDCAWERFGDDLILVHDPREALTLADPDGIVRALLESLSAAPATVDELTARLRGRGLDLASEDVRQGLQGLDSLGLVEKADEQWLGDSGLDERHFSNLTFFGTYSSLERSRADFVRKLRDAHVLVLGVGGGGSSLVQCLAGFGVGRLTLVDRDDVERRNFARQFLYRHADLGRSKVERAAEWVRDYDPDIEVRAVDRWISGPEDLADLMDGVDVVAGGLDGEHDIHLVVNAAIMRAGVPLVCGGMGRTQVMYCSVDPGVSPCLLCDESDQPSPTEQTSAGIARRLSSGLELNNALIAPIAMQVGSLIAYETLRYLTGFEQPMAAGQRVILDLRTGLTTQATPFPRDPHCPACALAPER